jgi:hypothetical protein
MNWKRRMRRNLLFALLGGVVATAAYVGLELTNGLHGFGIGALGPAIEIVRHDLDPNCDARSYCHLEVLAANVVLYAFWIFVASIGIDLLRQLKRRLAQ